MKKSTKYILAIIIGIALLVVGCYFVLGKEIFEEENEFGSWGQQMIINYADGTHESLSMLATNPFTITHSGSAVSSITYQLSAKATGTGYTSVGIDYSLYSVRFTIGTNIITRTFTGSPSSIPLDGDWHVICSTELSASQIQGTLAPGTYTMVSTGLGSIKYRGDTSPWQDVSIPSPLSFEITVNTDYSLVVEIGHGVDFEGTTPPAQFEDMTTYTHGGDITPPYLTFTTNSVTCTDMPRIAMCYLQKPRMIGSTDFTLSFSARATLLDTNPGLDMPGGTTCMLFTNNVATTDYMKAITGADGLSFTMREYTSTTGSTSYFFRVDSKTDGNTVYKEASKSLGVDYSIVITRTSGVISFTIDGVEVQPTKNLVDTTSIQYFLPMCGRGGGGADTLKATGALSNFEFS